MSNQENPEVVPRLTKEDEPVLLLKCDTSPFSQSSKTDIFMLFAKKLADKEKQYQLNVDPYYDEQLIIDKQDLPEEYRNLEIEKIPQTYKKSYVYLSLSLKEVK
jgi:hypothetical protein